MRHLLRMIKMTWIKKGIILDNGEQRAQMPTALVMSDRIRIYYNIRDKKQRSRMHYIDVDKKNPKKIIGKSKKEILPLGDTGAFDDAGVMPSCVVEGGGIYVMYYVGVSLGVSVPYKCHIGIATSVEGKVFRKCNILPTFDSFLATTPYVMGSNKIWYASGISWINSNGKMEPIYRIKGIKPKSKYEAQCRPAVIKIGNKYCMWFCYRGSFDFRGGKESYQIGYAESKDGIKWKRDDKKAGITLSKTGWDSEMQCYPNVVKVDDRYIMFYNGNAFGKSGIGYAEKMA